MRKHFDARIENDNLTDFHIGIRQYILEVLRLHYVISQ